MHAERHGFAPRAHAAGDRLRPLARRARRAGVPDRRRQVPPARGAGQPLPLDDGGTATIGVVHVDDVARILLAARPAGVEAHNVVAETITVADVAALAEGREPPGGAGWTFATAVPLRPRRRGIPAPMRLLVTGATGYLGWRHVHAADASAGTTSSRSPARAARPAPPPPTCASTTASTPATPRRASSSRLRRRPALRRRPRPRPRAAGPGDAPSARTSGRRSTCSRRARSTARCSSSRRPRAPGWTRRRTRTASPSASARRPAGCTQRGPSPCG